MAAVLYFGTWVFPYEVTIVLAIVTRLLLTGALHEDGLADFFDGFGGGGSDRQRILDIMKDSHIGTYGVLSLVIYFLLLFSILHSMTPLGAALLMAVADPYAKMVTAQFIQMMPYARTEETAKNLTVYRKFDIKAGISLAIQGLMPIAIYIYIMYAHVNWQLLIFVPAIALLSGLKVFSPQQGHLYILLIFIPFLPLHCPLSQWAPAPLQALPQELLPQAWVSAAAEFSSLPCVLCGKC